METACPRSLIAIARRLTGKEILGTAAKLDEA
jgi:hypothetical protein